MKNRNKIAFGSKTTSRILIGAWLILALAFIMYKGVFEGWNNTAGDFNNYYVSSVLVSQGEEIHQFYDTSWFLEKSHEMGVYDGAKFAPFPPITAFLYRPLAGLDFMTAKRAWLLFNVFLLLFLPFRIKRILNIPVLVAILIVSLFFVPLASNFNFGQAYLLITFFMIEAIGLAQREGKRNLAAIILAFCALLKYLPLLFILYLFDPIKGASAGMKAYLLKQKWILFFVGAVTVFMVASYLAWPKAYAAYFSTFSNHLQGDLSGQGKFAVGFQSLDSLLNNLFASGRVAFIDMPILKPIFKATFFAAIGLTCFQMFKSDGYHFNSINSSIFFLGAFALIPASASYHLLFILAPVIFIYKWLMSLENSRPMVIFTILLLMTFCIQAHHMPEIQFSQTVYCLILFPRLWCLLILFGYLSYIKLGLKHG